MTNSVTQHTVTQPVEGGVALQPVSRHMNALVGQAQPANNCPSLSVSVCINTWRSRFLLDTLCCLWDSWTVAGKNHKFIHTTIYLSVSLFLPVCWIRLCQSELHSC